MDKGAWKTISNIVTEDKVRNFIKDVREKLYGQLDEILLATVIAAKIGDGTLAYRMLVDCGIMPQLGKKTVDLNVAKIPPKETSQEIVYDIARELVAGAVERLKHFQSGVLGRTRPSY